MAATVKGIVTDVAVALMFAWCILFFFYQAGQTIGPDEHGVPYTGQVVHGDNTQAAACSPLDNIIIDASK